jgi:hypothetical protein
MSVFVHTEVFERLALWYCRIRGSARLRRFISVSSHCAERSPAYAGTDFAADYNI